MLINHDIVIETKISCLSHCNDACQNNIYSRKRIIYKSRSYQRILQCFIDISDHFRLSNDNSLHSRVTDENMHTYKVQESEIFM